jgi:hypothetical protein
MNRTERQMRDILRRGKDEFGVVSVKAEFEAEGTRVDELLRLIDIARAAELPITVKIGGCEAIRDLYESKQIGVSYIVAPMVESSYAVSKFVAAKNLVYSKEEQEDTQFLFNMETELAFLQRDKILPVAALDEGADGVVFGRVDFVGSRAASRESINAPEVLECVLNVASDCRTFGLDLVVGGGVSVDALPFLTRVSEVHLTRFETRKVVFSSDALANPHVQDGLLNAVHFELLWLLNKRDYYERLTTEDAKRIDMLESRWRVLHR